MSLSTGGREEGIWFDAAFNGRKNTLQNAWHWCEKINVRMKKANATVDRFRWQVGLALGNNGWSEDSKNIVGLGEGSACIIKG
jgi:hypothetical protein